MQHWSQNLSGSEMPNTTEKFLEQAQKLEDEINGNIKTAKRRIKKLLKRDLSNETAYGFLGIADKRDRMGKAVSRLKREEAKLETLKMQKQYWKGILRDEKEERDMEDL
ncbi:hypothetical protein SEUCBS139899_006837 [Sporothrix eucalyptigena]|uniref:Uncharacterized protein n=1 Tax=Sporothrix eucalyptigena TaxID=1812306 RepID=A0ABP0BH66_9PEZI